MQLYYCDLLPHPAWIRPQQCTTNKQRAKQANRQRGRPSSADPGKVDYGAKFLLEPCLRCKGVVALNRELGRDPKEFDPGRSRAPSTIAKQSAGSVEIVGAMARRKRINVDGPRLAPVHFDAQQVESVREEPRERAAPRRIIDPELVERVVSLAANPGGVMKGTGSDPNTDPLMTIALPEIAERLGLGVEGARQRVEMRSKLKPIPGTRPKRYARDQVEAWIKDQPVRFGNGRGKRLVRPPAPVAPPNGKSPKEYSFAEMLYVLRSKRDAAAEAAQAARDALTSAEAEVAKLDEAIKVVEGLA